MTPNKSIAACAKCKKDVQPKDRMHCTGCKNLFHIDCVISEKRYLLLDKERKANWSCPTCQRKRNTESENKGSPILTVPPKTHKDMTAKKSDSPTLPIVKVHDPTQQETNVAGKNSECPSGMKQEIVAMKEEIIQCLEARMEVLIKEQMDRWMEYFAAQIKQLSETVDSFKSRFLTIEERVDSLEKLVGSQEKDTSLALTVQRLKIEINARDQELLANDVEITGIPETNGRPLAVRLLRREQRDNLLRAARVRRGADTSGFNLPAASRPFYVNERLTGFNRQLFRKVREEKQRLHWRFAWTKEGVIFARQDHGKPAMRIRNEDDLTRVFGIATVSNG
ncbi:hypothetical protein NE865_00494 [Phthorimaea operculella]|nr:hypothetical protein NE865_00494 [Phthorimaea operculella]